MILIDFNGAVIGQLNSWKGPLTEDVVRHIILNTLRMYNKKFRGDYGAMYVCLEGRSWRKEQYPFYKSARKQGRDESHIDWDSVFEHINTVMGEIREHMPWIVLQHNRAEADDLIAVLAKSTQDFGRHEPVMIVSADKDLVQLQKYSNVRQYSTRTQKMLTTDSAEEFLIEQVLRGDRVDGIPNVLSADNCLTDGIRQTKLTQKQLDQMIKQREDGETFEGALEEQYKRNQELIDLSHIPSDIEKDVMIDIDRIDTNSLKSRHAQILPYLIQKRCRMLIDCIEDFYIKG